MLLYLVRHGEAKREEEDPDRRLTDRGVRDVQKAAAYAVRIRVRVNEIFHSPKPRARQTAQILADHLKPEKGMDQSDNLLPMDDPGLWGMRIAGMNEDVMIVGHLPYLARLAGLLLCKDAENRCVEFQMGGIVCLRRIDGVRWTIEWAVSPSMI